MMAIAVSACCASRSGKKLETVGPTVESATGAFRLSPEGRRVAYVSGTDIWVLDIARGNNARLTFQGGDLPIWTPDGKQIYYRCSPRGICRKAADWSGEEEVVATGLLEHPTSIAADGQTLLLGFHDIYRLTAAVGGQTAIVVEDTVPGGMGGCLAGRPLGGIQFK
jgi:Tol biopolymer transport system component